MTAPSELDYESLVSAGQDLAITNAKNKARLGELVNVVTERYGDQRVDDYSKDISEGDISARTLRSYRFVVAYYEGSAHVCRYIDQRVGWSVLRDTASHFGDSGKDDAAAFLEHVMSSGITTYKETMRALKGTDGAPKAPTLADELAATLAKMREVMAEVPEMLDTGAAFIMSAGHVSTAQAMFDMADTIRDALRPRVAAAAAGGGVAS
jgi:hypothetical protein